MSLPIEEQWRPVPGYEGLYDVSSTGRVRSWWQHNRKAPHILRQSIGTNGYRKVALHRGPDHRPRYGFLHVLVLEAFVGPRPDGLIIRHLDGDPLNNHVTNLCYGTQVENMADMVRHHGQHYEAARTHCPYGHPYDEANTLVRKGKQAGKRTCRACLKRRNDARSRSRSAAVTGHGTVSA